MIRVGYHIKPGTYFGRATAACIRLHASLKQPGTLFTSCMHTQIHTSTQTYVRTYIRTNSIIGPTTRVPIAPEANNNCHRMACTTLCSSCASDEQRKHHAQNRYFPCGTCTKNMRSYRPHSRKSTLSHPQAYTCAFQLTAVSQSVSRSVNRTKNTTVDPTRRWPAREAQRWRTLPRPQTPCVPRTGREPAPAMAVAAAAMALLAACWCPTRQRSCRTRPWRGLQWGAGSSGAASPRTGALA